MKTKRPPNRYAALAKYADSLQGKGRYSFRREEALDALGVSDEALQTAARRLTAKKRLVSPRRGFYVIVPLEYRSAGAPPPDWFIDELMKFQERPYYVGLLSAAALHGAAHQQPQEFQVVSDAPLRPTKAGRARLRFFTKRHFEPTPTLQMKTETGSMRVSTPEATALDLVRYASSAGHLANVATVLAELAEKIDDPAFTKDILPLLARGLAYDSDDAAYDAGCLAYDAPEEFDAVQAWADVHRAFITMLSGEAWKRPK